MHPEIHATKPGNCPKCGMRLIKEKPKAIVKQPEVKKQEVEKIKADTSNPKSINVQEAATYTCPMHPEIHSIKPGNCPKCGMTLVKKNNSHCYT